MVSAHGYSIRIGVASTISHATPTLRHQVLASYRAKPIQKRKGAFSVDYSYSPKHAIYCIRDGVGMKTWKFILLVSATVIVGAWVMLFAVVSSNGALRITATPDYRFEATRALGILSFVFDRRMAPEPVKVGDSRETVMQKLGAPEGEAASKGRTTLFYIGGGIDLVDGHVVEIETGFYRRSATREQAHRYAEEKRASGYVLYGGEWTTPRNAKQRRRADQQRRHLAYQAIMTKKWTESTPLPAKKVTCKKPRKRFPSFSRKYAHYPRSSWYAPRKISRSASYHKYLPKNKYRFGTKYRDRRNYCWADKRRGFDYRSGMTD